MTNLSFAQVFSLAELIKVARMNEDDADTFVTSKNYHYVKATHDEDRDNKAYAFGQDYDINSAKYWIVLYTRFYHDKGYVSWQTCQTKDYVSFKKQLKLAGYLFNRSKENKDGSTSFQYSKGNIEVEIFAATEKVLGGISNNYEIDITIKN